nr:immunoglobulin heavy chain junction region [Macaca mulatta]MOV39212.1 immunoglobulin heavy chain junction region [Macaca mulatta]MOV39298.1 immunoglobulin heavy chain junction region [Macaca mulatta]MOV40414.1 immunoglobulin heavy chain junction region [Macaca mulatta]MOV40493.1 immunoglobulin heavy chain junction region [Macaca mulatta]
CARDAFGSGFDFW